MDSSKAGQKSWLHALKIQNQFLQVMKINIYWPDTLTTLSALTSFNAAVCPDWSNGSVKTVQEDSGSGQMPLNNEETAPRFVVTGAEARQRQLPSALLTRRRLIVGLAPSVAQWKPMLCEVESRTTCGAAYDCEFRLAPSTTAGLPGNKRPISETEGHLHHQATSWKKTGIIFKILPKTNSNVSRICLLNLFQQMINHFLNLTRLTIQSTSSWKQTWNWHKNR